jgi:hypothetical protein
MPNDLPLPLDSEGNEFLVNLINTFGSWDGSLIPEIRLADGALAILDIVEGSGHQLDVMLRQALAERYFQEFLQLPNSLGSNLRLCSTNSIDASWNCNHLQKKCTSASAGRLRM